jgi:precorrin-8X/cobalt-precorrin-8 methylmutase
MDIERRSMELIGRELKVLVAAENEAVVKRVIHATADFDYAENLVFSENAVELGVSAIKRGCSIVTDTAMIMAGVNKKVLARFGGRVYNFMSDESVAEEARRRGRTRASVSMERAGALGLPLIYAIGNAPTALITLYELFVSGRLARPELVIGVPVGFVNVVEAKELIINTDVPHIVARGRKGGSNVAAAICNALIYLASGDARG